MKHRVRIVSVVLCCFLLSLGSVSGTGVVGSTENTGRTAMFGPGPDRDSLPSTFRAPSPDLPNSLDHSAGAGYSTMPDVVGQFINLQLHGDALAFRIGVGDNAAESHHYQGLARWQGVGTPYFFLTRSDEPGELLIVRLGSRGEDGERLRSNRLNPDLGMEDTVPPGDDVGVISIHFDGQSTDSNGNIWPGWNHPGGVQLVDNVLVVPMEDPFPGGGGSGAILLIDVSQPEQPTLIKEIKWVEGYPYALPKIGVMGVTKNPWDDNDNYLFLATGGGWDGFSNGRVVWFLESNTADLRDPALELTIADIWSTPELRDEDQWCWPCDLPCGIPLDPSVPCRREFQMLNFVRQTNGDLYLIGTDNQTPDTKMGDDYAFLFKVLRIESDFKLVYITERHLNLSRPEMGDLDAAAGVYVSPSGNLILYTGDHDNEGPMPPGCGDNACRVLEMGEFRNIDVYHPGTTARETMCPWLELYDDKLGWADYSPERSLMLDFQDRLLESWDNLPDENFNDKASSLRTFLAPGQLLTLYEDAYYGGEPKDIIGLGTVLSWEDLDVWPFEGWNDKISSVRIFPFADPGGPYNGSEGSSIPLDTANRCYRDDGATFTWSVDSPLCTLSSRAVRQPTLTCADNGSFTVNLTVTDGSDESGTPETTVTVENVAPAVTAEGSDIDESGWATVSGTITDPGAEDTFTVAIDWGDGSDTYSYPAGTTTYSELHQYPSPTGIYPVTVTVEDDDGGIGTASTSVNATRVFLPLVLKD